MKGQYNFLKQNAILKRFLRSNTLEQLEFKWEKMIRIRNPQEKMEKVYLIDLFTLALLRTELEASQLMVLTPTMRPLLSGRPNLVGLPLPAPIKKPINF